MKTRICLLMMAIFLIAGCNRKSAELSKEDQKAVNDPNESVDALVLMDTTTLPSNILPDTIISYSRSGCFGTCPVYNFILLEDGSATFKGIAYTKPLGLHQKNLDAHVFRGICDLINAASLEKYAGQHPQNQEEWIADLPTTTVIAKRPDIGRVFIRNNHSAPIEYRNFEKTLRKWVDSINWSPSQDGKSKH